MTATDLNAFVSTETVRKEMDALLELARTIGTEAGFHQVADELEKKLEPRLRLLREQMFRDSSEAGHARSRRIEDLDRERAELAARAAQYESRRDALYSQAAGWRERWPMALSITAGTLLIALGLEEFVGVVIRTRLAIIFGLTATLLILNLQSLIELPGRALKQWRQWRDYRADLQRTRALANQLETIRGEDLERSWIHDWTEEWMTHLRQAIRAEYDCAKNRAALARES
jgi:hypothetical protein